MKKLLVLLALAGLFSLSTTPLIANADVNDFTITNFTSDETLTRDDPQGQLHIIEHISVNFTDFNHGILRAIPESYKNHSLQLKINKVSSDSGAATQFTTYSSNGNTVLKIGDSSRTVTGAQEYTIDYTLRNVITFYVDHDELYWDINGDQWHQSFENVSTTLHLPVGLRLSLPPNCFTGEFGSTERNCEVTLPGDMVKVSTTKPLLPGQTLTYVAAFQPGYFHPSSWLETMAEHAAVIAETSIPFLVLSLGSLIWWFKRGRDVKGRGTIVPQYEAPEGLKPLEAGTIIDFKVDNRDITATIVDLAIRGYIKIIETKKVRKLGKDTLQYSLQVLKSDGELEAGSNEALLMRKLFGGDAVGTVIDISASKHKLYDTATFVRKNVEQDLTTQGYFRANPLKAGKPLVIAATISVIVIYLAGVLIGFAVSIGLGVGALVAFIASRFMPARTAKGVEAKEQILGLKLYLEVAEKDRIEKLQAPDAAYAANAREPVRTVELFEKLLPYAMVLGVEQQWAKQFESLYTTPPDWYSGNWTAFNAGYLASSLNNGVGQAVNTAFTPPSSSGSSGSGGGGFSGGGGGGGGGGGW